jgi:hypothetical protein
LQELKRGNTSNTANNVINKYLEVLLIVNSGLAPNYHKAHAITARQNFRGRKVEHKS